MILAIETSCDDTCVALLREDGTVAVNVTSSQAELHNRYGGVVPEVASRRHLELINTVVDTALEQAGVSFKEVSSVAATSGPGLIGALLVGLTTAKAIAAVRRLPFIEVNHLYGHIAANYLLDRPPDFPFLCLIASGGHTLLAQVDSYAEYTFLGSTLDDAAGEAFDKGARLLGLPYPGGIEIDRLAEGADRTAFDFPATARTAKELDFSYSGLKTALAYLLKELPEQEIAARKADIAASYQHAICRQLVDRARLAVRRTGIRELAVGGGVAANSELRRMLAELCTEEGAELYLPPTELCTDNAAMIARAARHLEPTPYPDYLAFDAFATSQ